jgi:hypothetical protein
MFEERVALFSHSNKICFFFYMYAANITHPSMRKIMQLFPQTEFKIRMSVLLQIKGKLYKLFDVF